MDGSLPAPNQRQPSGGLCGQVPEHVPARLLVHFSGGTWMKMQCLECGSDAVTERAERTAQGYRRFRCRRLWQAVQRALRNLRRCPSTPIDDGKADPLI